MDILQLTFKAKADADPEMMALRAGRDGIELETLREAEAKAERGNHYYRRLVETMARKGHGWIAYGIAESLEHWAEHDPDVITYSRPR